MPPTVVSAALPGWLDPATAHRHLHRDAEHAFWIDAGAGATSGWSWVGVGTVETDSDRVRAVDCASSTADAWDAGPFRGGWVGWVGYEAGARLAGAPVTRTDDGIPEERWLRVDTYLAFDHGRRRVWAVAPDEAAAQGLRKRSAEWTGAALEDAPPHPRVATARVRPERYAALIARCREHIRDGNAYQLCLTTRFQVTGAVDPLQTYRRLRSGSSVQRGGLVRSGDVALLSASPERFLEVSGGVVRTHPIKGTRPRGADEERDAALARELRADPKEQAENVMIVDLMRNDLSRVCVPSSVGVDRLLEVETYPTVHQLVSTVSGTLLPGTTLGDLLEAAFPAGSMTGAPKLSAMGILHGLEGGPRGVYAGCFGWVGANGDLDLAMVIRSILTHPDGAYVGAGGGITWRSRPESEVAEVGIKARAPLAALGAELPPGW